MSPCMEYHSLIPASCSTPARAPCLCNRLFCLTFVFLAHLHPLQWIQTKQLHTILQHLPSRHIKRHTCSLQLLLTPHNLQMVITATQCVCHPEKVCKDGDGLLCLDGHLEDIWPLHKGSSEIYSVLFREEGEVCCEEGFGGNAGSANDGRETGVGVLEVGTCVALEGGHRVSAVLVVVDTGTMLAIFTSQW